MNSPADFALAGAVLEFLRDKDTTFHKQFFGQSDFDNLDDPIKLPDGKIVQVDIYYVDQDLAYGHTP